MKSTTVKWSKIFILQVFIFTLSGCETNIDESNLSNVKRRKHLVIKPCRQNGKDSSINISVPTDGNPNCDYIAVHTWTILSKITIGRGLLSFNTQSISESVEIDSVFLKLFLIQESSFDPTFNGNSGNNEFYVQRITSEWDDEKVNWINQPDFTYQDQIIVPAVNNTSEGFVRINITKMFQASLHSENSNKEIGFYLKLVKEEVYSKIYIASSNHDDHEKHPELEIYYREVEIQ